MTENRYRIVTAEKDRRIVREAESHIPHEWPEFMLHDKAADLFPALYEKIPDCQFVVLDTQSDEAVAIGNSVPLEWTDPIDGLPDTGWDWAIRKGVEDYDNRRNTNLLCALQIVVFSPYRGKGFSHLGVEAMRHICRDNGLAFLIAPVRPSAKCDHPHVAIHDYITWKNDEGLPKDPWLRVHVRAGARIVKPCERAMEISGTAAEWHRWTGISFDRSGAYIVPGALVPVAYDGESDIARYIEPNVWMAHAPLVRTSEQS